MTWHILLNRLQQVVDTEIHLLYEKIGAFNDYNYDE